MDQNLLKHVRVLTSRDEKTLTQKTLKTVEEVGELAKVVLPFENAFATRHRVVHRARILEEVADTMLCALSVAYDLGFDDDAIRDMMADKAERWAELQNNESGLKYPLPYEIHITVNDGPLYAAASFKAACAEIGVKPILLDLQDRDGGVVMPDMMTSSKHLGDNTTALDEVARISAGLRAADFTVIREKIETVPWHPSAPRRRFDADGTRLPDPPMPKDCYFECHFGVLTSPERMDELGTLARSLDCHRSRNIFKRHSEDCVTVMLTHRKYEGCYEDFKERVAAIETALASAKFETEKTIIEFSLWDTRVSHDSAWLMAA